MTWACWLQCPPQWGGKAEKSELSFFEHQAFREAAITHCWQSHCLVGNWGWFCVVVSAEVQTAASGGPSLFSGSKGVQDMMLQVAIHAWGGSGCGVGLTGFLLAAPHRTKVTLIKADMDLYKEGKVWCCVSHWSECSSMPPHCICRAVAYSFTDHSVLLQLFLLVYFDSFPPSLQHSYMFSDWHHRTIKTELRHLFGFILEFTHIYVFIHDSWTSVL